MDKAGVAAKTPIRVQVTEADRNRYIVRQSSLERAIETLSGGGVFGVQEVTQVAAQYEAWVFRPIDIEVSSAKEAIAVVKAVAPAASAVEVRRPGRPKKVLATPELPHDDDIPSEALDGVE